MTAASTRDAARRPRPTRSRRRVGRLGRLGSTRRCFFETIGSTNDVAASARPRAEPAKALVVVADEQTAGRGRRGHTWFSPPGSGLVRVGGARAGARARRSRARDDAADAGRRRRARRRHRARRPGCASISSGRTICRSSRRKLGGILAEVVRRRRSVGHRRRRLRHQRAVRRRFRRSCAIARRRSSPSSDAPSIAHQLLAETLAALSRRYEDLLAGRFDAILDAWRAPRAGARPARA